MEPSKINFNNPPEKPVSNLDKRISPPESVEYVSKFENIKEGLEKLFKIEVTSEASLAYPWVKDEMYREVLEDFEAGKPFALDYMFEEGLLTKEDLKERGFQEMKQQALKIMSTFNGQRLAWAKNLFENAGMVFTEEELTAIGL